MDNITPFGNQILVEPYTKKQVLVSDSGTLCEYGTVIAIGDEVQKVKVGDVLGYTIWGINSLQVDDKKYHFIQETDEFILGTLKMSGGLVA